MVTVALPLAAAAAPAHGGVSPAVVKGTVKVFA
jgi:hypothetical protein